MSDEKRLEDPKRHGSSLSRTKSVSAKYLFLDVVDYTVKRSIEAQVAIIRTLNDLVRASLRAVVPKSKKILLPTGDGLCIALLGETAAIDATLRVALDLLRRLKFLNSRQADPSRVFEVRIALSTNYDNLVTDINRRPNIAGAGINLAQRILSIADGNQIMVGQQVYDLLIQRERYMGNFREYPVTLKHGVSAKVYQYVQVETPGLNTDVPARFRPRDVLPSKLSKHAAHYMAQAHKYREFLKGNVTQGQQAYAATVLLYFLSWDSLRKSETTELDEFKPRSWGYGKPITEQFKHYMDLDFWVCTKLHDYIVKQLFDNVFGCFEASNTTLFRYHFLSSGGTARLKGEWPEVWRAFHLDDADSKPVSSRAGSASD
jgi:class 3 adenylate cyclase